MTGVLSLSVGRDDDHSHLAEHFAHDFDGGLDNGGGDETFAFEKANNKAAVYCGGLVEVGIVKHFDNLTVLSSHVTSSGRHVLERDTHRIVDNNAAAVYVVNGRHANNSKLREYMSDESCVVGKSLNGESSLMPEEPTDAVSYVGMMWSRSDAKWTEAGGVILNMVELAKVRLWVRETTRAKKV